MNSVVHSAREGEVVECAAPTFKPSKDARAGRFKKLKLIGSAGLALDDDGPGAGPAATDEAFGEGPIEYVQRVRLRLAAHLLGATDLSVKVIASSIGYRSRRTSWKPNAVGAE